MAFLRRYWSKLSTEDAGDLLLNCVTAVGAGGTLAYAVYKDWPPTTDTDRIAVRGLAFGAGGVGFRYGSMIAIGFGLSILDRGPKAIGITAAVAATAFVGYQAGNLAKRWPKWKAERAERQRLAAIESAKAESIRLQARLFELQRPTTKTEREPMQEDFM